jgi:hypothetical protein
MKDLSESDFLYQSGQELFLVVTGETEDTYQFAVHGWREIDKDRIEEYIEDSRSKVHRQADVEQIIKESDDESVEREFNKLKQLFAVYEQVDLPDEGPHVDFRLEE